MEQLRNRLEQLVAVESHPVRNVEHTTFNRLMYRNRNQHRHGFYFTKLEHVRRLLRKIQRHVAWRSIRNAVTLKTATKPKLPASTPMSLSTVTHADLKSLQHIYSHLVGTLILSAAETVTTQLVSRSHFLPFAVTVLSVLARLHVLENNIFKQLQGALLELELLLFVHNPNRQLVPHSNSRSDRNKEDLGIQIDVTRAANAQPRFPAALAIEQQAIHVITNQSRPLDKPDNFSKSPPYKRAKLSDNDHNARDTASSSLYQRISSHHPPAPVPISFTGRAAVSLPPLNSARTDNSKNNATKKDTCRGRSQAAVVSDSLTSSICAQKVCSDALSSHQHDAGNATGTSNMHPNEPVNKTATPTAYMKSTPNADNSDSEDLDDIFGALDD